MHGGTTALGLRLASVRPSIPAKSRPSSFFTCSVSPTTSRRGLSTAVLLAPAPRRLASSKFSLLAANPSSSTATPSSFFTPSLCRVRNASTTTTSPSSDPTPATPAGTINPPASSVVLDWNNFFRLRQSRRRYSLTSSILGSIAATAGAITYISENMEIADQVQKIIPTDPIVGLGIATFAATFLGWLLGPILGNGVWRLLHRSRLPEFTIKERAFFERIKRHRVNPSGASTNNPVPDFYGEKIGSVAGYRRWLKDQRAFNRKRGGNYV